MVSPLSDDWPGWLHPQHGSSYSGQPGTDGQTEVESLTAAPVHHQKWHTSLLIFPYRRAINVANNCQFWKRARGHLLPLSSRWSRASRHMLIWYTCPEGRQKEQKITFTFKGKHKREADLTQCSPAQTPAICRADEGHSMFRISIGFICLECKMASFGVYLNYPAAVKKCTFLYRAEIHETIQHY